MATEDIYITSWTEDTGKTGFTGVGSEPYLDAQDQPSNYVWTATKKGSIGDFEFGPSSVGTGTLNSVDLYVYAQDAGGPLALDEFWVSGNDGVDWDAYNPTIPASWGWASISVMATLDTWGKIDAAELYVKHRNSSDRLDLDAAYLHIDYSLEGKIPKFIKPVAYPEREHLEV